MSRNLGNNRTKQTMRNRQIEKQEGEKNTEGKPKRRINRAYILRRKLKNAVPKLLMAMVVLMVGGILWVIASQNGVVLADKPEEIAFEAAAVEPATVTQSNQIVIQRSTYEIAGQGVAVRVKGDPNPENNGLFYLYKDHLGSVVSVTDEDGNLVSDITRFYPYGTPRSGGTGDVTDQGFTGHKHNDDLGLIYMNSRYYVPGIGRFASADTIVPDPTDPQTFNRYSYVNNNPVKYTDPTGHCVWDVCIVEGVLIAALAVMVYEAVTPNQDVVADLSQGLTDIVYQIGDDLENGSEAANYGFDLLKRELAGHTASSPGDLDPNDDKDYSDSGARRILPDSVQKELKNIFDNPEYGIEGHNCDVCANQVKQTFSNHGIDARIVRIRFPGANGISVEQNGKMVQLSANDSHYYTVSDGVVYDSLTGSTGMSEAEYLAKYFDPIVDEGIFNYVKIPLP